MTLGDRIVVMKDGVIQQEDPPLLTYHYPVNRFVAGFIGMPPMNFFNGALRVEEGELVFEEGTLHLRGSPEPGEPEQPQGGGLREVEVEKGAPGVVPRAAELTFPGNGFRLSLSRLSRNVRERLVSRVGGHVVLGIRPEHLSLRPMQDGVSAPVQMNVNIIEPLGHDMDVYMRTALHDHVVGRVEAPTGSVSAGLQVDAQATIYVDLRKIHVFEPGETGMNLTLETSSSPATEPAHALA